MSKEKKDAENSKVAATTEAVKKVKSFTEVPKTFEEMGATKECAEALRHMGKTPQGLVNELRRESLGSQFREDEKKYRLEDEYTTTSTQDCYRTIKCILDVSFVEPFIDPNAYEKRLRLIVPVDKVMIYSYYYSETVDEVILASPELYENLNQYCISGVRLARYVQNIMPDPLEDDYFMVQELFDYWETFADVQTLISMGRDRVLELRFLQKYPRKRSTINKIKDVLSDWSETESFLTAIKNCLEKTD